MNKLIQSVRLDKRDIRVLRVDEIFSESSRFDWIPKRNGQDDDIEDAEFGTKKRSGAGTIEVQSNRLDCRRSLYWNQSCRSDRIEF